MAIEDTQTSGAVAAAPGADPDVSQETREPSQEAILAEIKAAEKEGRAYDRSKIAGEAKTPEAATDYGSKLDGRLKDEPKAVKFADPNPQAVAMQRSAEQITAKLEQLAKHLETTAENSAARIKTEMQIEQLELQASEVIQAYKDLISSEFQEAFNSDKNFAEQHAYYSKHLQDLGDDFSNAVMGDPNRVKILSSLYDWLDQPGALQAFMSAPAEARMNALKNFSATLKYGNRLPAAQTRPQALADRLSPAQPPPPALPPSLPPSNPLAGIKPPKDAPGNGAAGGSDPNDQMAALKRLKEKKLI